VEVTNTTPHC